MIQGQPRLLLVDDEPNVVEGIMRKLRREFSIFSANDGRQALKVLEQQGEMHVIVTDMRMPLMSGAQLLAEVAKLYPDMVRILLTGQADLNSAISAVNDGQIFRFLVKPCPSEVLRVQLQAALRQHELVTSERVLLEQTLRGAVQTLSDVLALALPEAFGRATRLRERARTLAEAVGIRDAWRVEVAATLSQIGAVSLSSEIVTKLYHGKTLTSDEQVAVDKLPAIAIDLLKPIARLSTVCELISLGFSPDKPSVPASLEAQVLRVSTDFDALYAAGRAVPDAINELQKRGFDPGLLASLSTLAANETAHRGLMDVSFRDLQAGMVLAEDVYSTSGTLILARGHAIRANVIERLRALQGTLGGRHTLRVRLSE
ncbi:MAG: HD domain-containing phosphohydrolase [Polyangiales bacterium]